MFDRFLMHVNALWDEGRDVWGEESSGSAGSRSCGQRQDITTGVPAGRPKARLASPVGSGGFGPPFPLISAAAAGEKFRSTHAGSGTIGLPILADTTR